MSPRAQLVKHVLCETSGPGHQPARGLAYNARPLVTRDNRAKWVGANLSSIICSTRDKRRRNLFAVSNITVFFCYVPPAWYYLDVLICASVYIYFYFLSFITFYFFMIFSTDLVV